MSKLQSAPGATQSDDDASDTKSGRKRPYASPILHMSSSETTSKSYTPAELNALGGPS